MNVLNRESVLIMGNSYKGELSPLGEKRNGKIVKLVRGGDRIGGKVLSKMHVKKTFKNSIGSDYSY